MKKHLIFQFNANLVYSANILWSSVRDLKNGLPSVVVADLIGLVSKLLVVVSSKFRFSLEDLSGPDDLRSKVGMDNVSIKFNGIFSVVGFIKATIFKIDQCVEVTLDC